MEDQTGGYGPLNTALLVLALVLVLGISAAYRIHIGCPSWPQPVDAGR